MDARDDSIPTVATHRGVGIHAFQPAARIEAVVKPAIDQVYGLSDADTLVAYVQDPRHPPEARLLAAARCEALWQLATEDRAVRPKISLTMLHAWTAGLDSQTWMSPTHYGTLLQHPLEPGQRLPERDAQWADDVRQARGSAHPVGRAAATSRRPK